MWLEYFKLSEEFPILKKYHKPGFHGMRMLAESGELPVPIFDSCPACKKEWAFDANGGVFEPLLNEQDAIISDELNHASIIDGVRLCKAQRFRYRNNDMADLEQQLQGARACRFQIPTWKLF